MRAIRNLKDPTIQKTFQMLLVCLIAAAAQVLAAASASASASAPAPATVLGNYVNDLSELAGAPMQVPMVKCINERNAKYICDCYNVYQSMQMPNLSGIIFQMEIRNCKRLSIDVNTFSKVQSLHKINFKQIERLVLHRDAFSSSRTALNLDFVDVNFELIDSHAFNGNIEQLSITGGRIDLLKPFGFTAFKNEQAIDFRLIGVQLRRIEQQAFKKFAIEQLTLRNCSFESELPTRAFYDLEVRKAFKLEHNQFKDVCTHAFSIKIIGSLYIIGNRFESSAGEWFEAHVHDNIVLRDNDFGSSDELALRALRLQRDAQRSVRPALQLINNTVGTPTSYEFDNDFDVQLERLYYNMSWSCADMLDNTKEPALPKSAFFRAYADNIYFRQRRTTAAQAAAAQFVVLSKLIETECRSSMLLIGVVTISLLGLFVVIVIIALFIWRQRRAAAKQRERAKLDIVQPEPRTYKETQIIYQIENAGLLKTDL